MSNQNKSRHSPLWIYHVASVTDLLGPGERLVLWLSGCHFRCKGCIDPAQWHKESGNSISPSDLKDALSDLLESKAGITFSGGEPLLQAEALLDFINLIPKDMDKMLFTGFELNEMSSLQKEVRSRMDISIEGRYIASKSGDFLWRGSSNKELFSPTGKYDSKTLEQWGKSSSAGISVHLEDQSILFYGVPKKGALKELETQFKARGITLHRGLTT